LRATESHLVHGALAIRGRLGAVDSLSGKGVQAPFVFSVAYRDRVVKCWALSALACRKGRAICPPSAKRFEHRNLIDDQCGF
jgi:hypothetical protein